MHAFTLSAIAATFIGVTMAADLSKRVPSYPLSPPSYPHSGETVTVTVTPAYCLSSTVQSPVSTQPGYPEMSATSSMTGPLATTSEMPKQQIPPVPMTFTYPHKVGSTTMSIEVLSTTMTLPTPGLSSEAAPSYPHSSGTTTISFEYPATTQMVSSSATPSSSPLSTTCITDTSYSVVSQTTQAPTFAQQMPSSEPSSPANQTLLSYSPSKSYPRPTEMPTDVTGGAGKVHVSMGVLLLLAALMVTL